MPDGIVDVGLNFQPFIDQLSEASKAYERMAGVARDYQQAQNGPLQQAARDAISLKNSLFAAAAETANAKRVQAELNAEIRKASAEYERAEKALKKASSPDEFNKWQGEVNRTTQALKRLTTEQELNNEAARKGATDVDRYTAATRKLTQEKQLERAAQKDLNNEIRAEAAAQKEAAATAQQASTGTAESSGGGFFGGLLGKLGPAAAGLFAFGKIVDKVKEGLANFADITAVQNTFKALTGSASQGAREYGYVKQQANELGLELISTAKAYTGLYAAAKEANLPTEQTREIFSAITAESKTLGLSQNDLERALKAVQQMLSKGTVSAEELRGQLGDVFPDATAKAARALGVTTAELDKMLKKGQIVAADFLPKFAAEIKKSYGGATADAATAVQSNLGRINTFIQESTAKIGAFVAPAVAAVADLVSSTKRASEATSEEQQSLEQSLVAITSLNVGNSERTRLIKELQAEYPAFLGNINAEKVSNEELSGAIDKVSESLVNRILIQKEDEKIAEQAAKTAEVKKKQLEAEIGIRRELAALNLERQKNINSSNGVRAIEDNGSVGFGVDFRTENQGLPIDVAAQNTLDLISKQKVAVSTLSPAYRRLFQDLQDYKAAQVALNTEEDKGNELTRQKALFMQALGISTAASTGALAGNAAALTKSIDALQAHRAEVAKQQEALTTNDYNDPKYRAQLAAFKADIDKTDALIKELEGKQDKSAIAKENKQKALLAAYEREQQTYKELALKAAEAQQEDARVASEKQFQLDLTNIYEASRKLKAAKKAAGKGDELDPVQTEQESILLQGAYDAHYKRLLGIRRTYQDNLLSLETDADKQELDALDIKFARELEKYEKQPALLKQAQEKYDKERRELLNKQANANNDTAEAGAVADATAEFLAGGHLDAVQAERKKQEALLAVHLEFAEKRLKIAEALDAAEGTEKTRTAVVNLQNVIAEMGNQLKELKKQDKAFNIAKLVFGENYTPGQEKALQQIADVAVSSLYSILQAQQQTAAATATQATQAISELQSQIQSQIALREDGAASNIRGLESEIAQQRQIRREALEQQRKAAREQVILDTLLQASNIITAASEVYKAFAAIPYVGVPLGIAAAGLLVGSFAASKVAAYEAAGKVGGAGFFKGGYTGSSTGDLHEERGPVHAKEFVFDHEKTAKYREPLFEALHAGRPGEIDWSHPTLAALLPGRPNVWDTPQMRSIMPDYALPGRLREERQAQVALRDSMSMEPIRQELAGMREDIAHIRGNTKETADRWDSHRTEEGYILIDPKTGSTHHIKTT